MNLNQIKSLWFLELFHFGEKNREKATYFSSLCCGYIHSYLSDFLTKNSLIGCLVFTILARACWDTLHFMANKQARWTLPNNSTFEIRLTRVPPKKQFILANEKSRIHYSPSFAVMQRMMSLQHFLEECNASHFESVLKMRNYFEAVSSKYDDTAFWRFFLRTPADLLWSNISWWQVNFEAVRID